MALKNIVLFNNTTLSERINALLVFLLEQKALSLSLREV